MALRRGSQGTPHSTDLQISVGQYYWTLSPAKILLTVLCMGAIIWAVFHAETSAKQPLDYAAYVIIIVGPLLLGLLLSPTPKPESFTETAAIAVDYLDEMLRADEALIEEIGLNLRHTTASTDSSLLVRIGEELGRQRLQLGRQVAHWAKVSPGVGDEIVKGRESRASILRRLEEEDFNV